MSPYGSGGKDQVVDGVRLDAIAGCEGVGSAKIGVPSFARIGRVGSLPYCDREEALAEEPAAAFDGAASMPMAWAVAALPSRQQEALILFEYEAAL